MEGGDIAVGNPFFEGRFRSYSAIYPEDFQDELDDLFADDNVIFQIIYNKSGRQIGNIRENEILMPANVNFTIAGVERIPGTGTGPDSPLRILIVLDRGVTYCGKEV